MQRFWFKNTPADKQVSNTIDTSEKDAYTYISEYTVPKILTPKQSCFFFDIF